MLPGFRFLFAAILVSISLLVFGVGAAALLRATHEQFVANPSWRTGPQEQVFAQAPEPAQPVLAALRADPEASEPAPALPDQGPTNATRVGDGERAPALAPEPASPAETPELDMRQPEVRSEAAAATVSAPTETATSAPAADASPAVPETPAATAADQSPTQMAAQMAALSDPTTTVENAAPAKAKAANAAPEKLEKKRAARPKKRHRAVRRAPPAATTPAVQQRFDPFALQQPALTPTAATTKPAR